MWEDFLYKKNYDKWYNDFIDEVDLSNINWVKLNSEELLNFYNNNYYDKDIDCFVLSTKENSMVVSPFGLELTSYSSDNACYEFIHLLGIVPNRKGTYTIVSKIKMHEKYKYVSDMDECIFIDYIEVNRFFRQRGIYKLTIDALTKFIDLNKNIVLTNETKEGKECRVHELFRKILNENSFVGVVKTEEDMAKEINKSLQKRLRK